MIRFVIKRICLIPLMLILITAIIFFLINSIDINPGAAILGFNATPEAIEELNEELGYYKPKIVQYINYMGDLLRGDMGASYYTKNAVIDEVMARLPNTLILSLSSVAVALIIGLPLGIVAAVKQYSFADNFFTVLAMIVSSTTNFWLAMMLLILFALKLSWFPASWNASQGIKGWILPVATASIPYIATFMRFVRSAMLDCTRQDYVTTARAKGCPENTVITHHILRNSLMPIITVAGLTAGTMMASTVVVESVFSISGLGSLILNAVKQKDVPMVMGAMIIFGLIFAIITLIIDVLYGFADPRIKAQYTSQGKKRRHKKKASAQAA